MFKQFKNYILILSIAIVVIAILMPNWHGPLILWRVIFFLSVTIYAGEAVYDTLFRNRSNLTRIDHADWASRLVTVLGISILFTGLILVEMLVLERIRIAIYICMFGIWLMLKVRPELGATIRAWRGEDDHPNPIDEEPKLAQRSSKRRKKRKRSKKRKKHKKF
jgi:hypothetical protein